jgi:hypothetical protein
MMPPTPKGAGPTAQSPHLNAVLRRMEEFDAGPETPWGAQGVEGRRRRRFYLLAAALAIGFFLPVFPPSEPTGSYYSRPSVQRSGPVFVNIEEGLSFNSKAPALFRILLVYPLLAAFAVGAILWLPNGLRAVLLIGLGLLPLVLALSIDELWRGLQVFGKQGSLPVYLLASLLASTALFISTRVRAYRPRSRPAYVIGLMGGGLAILGLFFPVLPKELGWMPICMTLKFVGDHVHKGASTLGMIGLLQTGLVVAASVTCFINVPVRKPAAMRQRANLAFGLLMGSIALGCATMGLLPTLLSERDFNALFALSFPLKILLGVGAVMVMVPLGLVDLIVGTPPTAPVLPVAEVDTEPLSGPSPVSPPSDKVS